MLNKHKPTSIDGRTRYSRFQRNPIKEKNRIAQLPIPENHPLVRQIEELKEENANLRATVRFLQDLYLLEE